MRKELEKALRELAEIQEKQGYLIRDLKLSLEAQLVKHDNLERRVETINAVMAFNGPKVHLNTPEKVMKISDETLDRIEALLQKYRY
jgi:vacuolar-type H+-ATPase subunit I/STV1